MGTARFASQWLRLAKALSVVCILLVVAAANAWCAMPYLVLEWWTWPLLVSIGLGLNPAFAFSCGWVGAGARSWLGTAMCVSGVIAIVVIAPGVWAAFLSGPRFLLPGIRESVGWYHPPYIAGMALLYIAGRWVRVRIRRARAKRTRAAEIQQDP